MAADFTPLVNTAKALTEVVENKKKQLAAIKADAKNPDHTPQVIALFESHLAQAQADLDAVNKSIGEAQKAAKKK